MRTIDLSKVDRQHQPSMSYEEYKEELKKTRAERKSLQPMPEDMCCSEQSIERMSTAAIIHHQNRIAS